MDALTRFAIVYVLVGAGVVTVWRTPSLRWIWDWSLTVRIGRFRGIPTLDMSVKSRTPPPWRRGARK
jgi:hypothetical protein